MKEVGNTTDGRKHCWLCESRLTHLNRELELPSIETVLFRTEFWSCIVDVAPICVGHLLIVPRRHIDDYSQLNSMELQDLQECYERISSFAQNGFEYIFFEHCDGTAGKRNCVDHTHVHCLPVSRHLAESGIAACATRAAEQVTRQDESYLILRLRNDEHIFFGKEVAEQARSQIEFLVAGETAPWRRRLAEDFDLVEERIRETLKVARSRG